MVSEQGTSFTSNTRADYLEEPRQDKTDLSGLLAPCSTQDTVTHVGGAAGRMAARLRPVFAGLGIPMTMFGIVGMVMAVKGASKVSLGVVAGIAPGSILLAAVGWSAWLGRWRHSLTPLHRFTSVGDGWGAIKSQSRSQIEASSVGRCL